MCSIDLYNFDDFFYEIDIEAYRKIVDVIKQIEGKWYNPKTRKYNIPKAGFDDFRAKIKDIAEVTLKGDRPPMESKKNSGKSPKIHLLSTERFAVFAPYKQEVIDFFKSARGRFCGNTKEWEFNMTDYNYVMDYLKMQYPDMQQ